MTSVCLLASFHGTTAHIYLDPGLIPLQHGRSLFSPLPLVYRPHCMDEGVINPNGASRKVIHVS